ncbi:phosphoglycerate kinase [bacterium]|nr:phosphoglycerate kinase [bacterium]|tara:strand:- start:5951 stop:7051 length:1101 start_codon:yes stop_codon:yes gene_type:complete
MIKYLSKAPKRALREKTCIVRVDLNIEDPSEENALRIQAVIPTIKLLLKLNAKIILISHRGRPKGKDTKLSLKPFAPILTKKLKRGIVFIPHFRFPQLKKEIETSSVKIFLLENLRFHKGEEKNDRAFAKNLAYLADVYINEAFAASHRKHASIAAITKYLPSYAGLRLEEETKQLHKAIHKYKKPLTIILGGAKIENKFEVVKYFKNKANYILLGGGVANTFLAEKGHPVGNSLVDRSVNMKPYLHMKQIICPRDWKTQKDEIMDIGKETAEAFVKIIKKSKTIIWGGPVGYIEKEKFAGGSKAIAYAIAKRKDKLLSIAGGGETTDFILKHNLLNRFDLVSTGGGAMLEYLSGKKLPGIEALKK